MILTLLGPVYASTANTARVSGMARLHLDLVDGSQTSLVIPLSVVVTAGGPDVGTLFLTVGSLAGFSALLSIGVRQMDIHGTVAPGVLTLS